LLSGAPGKLGKISTERRLNKAVNGVSCIDDDDDVCMYACSMISVVLSTIHINAFDVKALRAFRVLRPLKLVSGVPSQ